MPALRDLGASFRCVDGRLMRHDPKPDDPWLETDRGECPDCGGFGCDRMAEADREIERILAMSEAEILADCLERGEDPSEIAAHGRAIMQRAVDRVANDKTNDALRKMDKNND